MNRTTYVALAILLGAGVFVQTAEADTFGSGANSFDIDFVTIGNPGNTADTTGQPNPAGSVVYSYRIGKYEISEQMIDKANTLGGLGISKSAWGADKAVTKITWFDAARFVNWLNASTGSSPAYKFDGGGNFQLWQPSDPGYNPNNLYRNSLASYFLPSVDEWYKAAYYNPASGVYYDYPTGSNISPTDVASGTASGTAVYHQDLSAGPADITNAGGLSPYGTMAQGGNVTEWEETEIDRINDSISSLRGRRGGYWEDDSFSLSATARAGGSPSVPLNSTGFRVASSTPEPCTSLLFGLGILGAYGFTGRISSTRRFYYAESRR